MWRLNLTYIKHYNVACHMVSTRWEVAVITDVAIIDTGFSEFCGYMWDNKVKGSTVSYKIFSINFSP